ncbi:MAG TPA: methionine aminopeptidase [Microbacteriaceae bacterium]|nr:methionine aminopeptidase [Microbacteriaceae bacterium]
MSEQDRDEDFPATGTETEYWYNDRTGEVEIGPQSLAIDRIGPFKTREEAERALDIVRQRSEAWDQDED